jgi:glucan phosphoethanolaminetransferase (alkaline phosphatase superfamily)
MMLFLLYCFFNFSFRRIVIKIITYVLPGFFCQFWTIIYLGLMARLSPFGGRRVKIHARFNAKRWAVDGGSG